MYHTLFSCSWLCFCRVISAISWLVVDLPAILVSKLFYIHNTFAHSRKKKYTMHSIRYALTVHLAERHCFFFWEKMFANLKVFRASKVQC